MFKDFTVLLLCGLSMYLVKWPPGSHRFPVHPGGGSCDDIDTSSENVMVGYMTSSAANWTVLRTFSYSSFTSSVSPALYGEE